MERGRRLTATPHLAVYDPTVQFEFWFSEKRIADIRQVETSARYLGTALYWIYKLRSKYLGGTRLSRYVYGVVSEYQYRW